MSQKLDFLQGPAEEVAPLLLGCELVVELDGAEVRCRIVETEAYNQSDAASHSYKGKTTRTEVMFGPSGYVYVYFTYGMHYCCNIVTGAEGEGSAVLLRAAEITSGLEVAVQRRHGISGADMANGPAKLCQALGIDKKFNGHDLASSPLRLIVNKPVSQDRIVQTVRVGISQAKDVPWRFYLKDCPYVSKK